MKLRCNLFVNKRGKHVETKGEFKQEVQNYTVHNSGNVVFPNSNAEIPYSQIGKIRVPNPEEKITMDVSAIEKMKRECAKAKKAHFQYAELLLGLSTLLWGAFLSAIVSKVTYEFECISVFFYTICPMLGLGSGIAYLLCRINDIEDIRNFAEKIEECIPDFDEVREDDIK